MCCAYMKHILYIRYRYFFCLNPDSMRFKRFEQLIVYLPKIILKVKYPPKCKLILAQKRLCLAVFTKAKMQKIFRPNPDFWKI